MDTARTTAGTGPEQTLRDTGATADGPERNGARPRAGLWRHRDFLYLWAGQSTSMLGSAVSFIALPLVGVLLLDLDAFRMGVIATAGVLPSLVVGPFIGPVVDRRDRRRLMIVADGGRALLMASVPVAHWLGVLGFAQLVLIAAAMGVLTLLFNVAHQAYLPSIVADESLGDGNAKLEASQSLTEVGGPGLAGWLIGAGGPALGVLGDAVSYVVSVCCLLRIRGASPKRDASPPAPASASTTTPAPSAPGSRGGRAAAFLHDTKTGFRVLWQDPVLRAITVSYSALAFGSQLQNAVYMLFLVRWIHFGPTMIAVVFTLSSVVGFGAALMSGRLADRLGVGRLIVIGQAVMVAGGVLLAVVAGSAMQAGGTMLVAEACFASGLSFYGVGNRTLNQTRVADEVRGRVIGASRVLTGVGTALSGLVGGGVGAVFGLRTAMLVGAAAMVAALMLVLRPRVWAVQAGAGEEAAGL